MNHKNIVWIASAFFLSCQKEEIPVPAHEPGDALINSVEMGPDYGQQLFFSLDENKVISSNPRSDWDLAFEASDTGWHVCLNTSRGMAVSQSHGSFGEVTDTAGANWSWDSHTGNRDSTAIGDWKVHEGIYLVDLGYDGITHLGFAKIKLMGVTAESYAFLCGELSDTDPVSLTISKDPVHTFVYFNLRTKQTVSIAPPDARWDLLFTQYTHIFEGPTPYLVTGVLLNPRATSGCLITDHSFEDIDFEFAQTVNYSDQLNTIGYNWKYFDFAQGQYLVYPELIYLIHTQNGYYYKLHFTDFYNSSGIKGYPRFEFCRL